jgi:hypothetical protein
MRSLRILHTRLVRNALHSMYYIMALRAGSIHLFVRRFHLRNYLTVFACDSYWWSTSDVVGRINLFAYRQNNAQFTCSSNPILNFSLKG